MSTPDVFNRGMVGEKASEGDKGRTDRKLPPQRLSIVFFFSLGFAGDMSLIFVSSLITGTGFTQGTRFQHRTSCGDAEHQYHQKVNDDWGRLYPIGNGLSKRK